MGRAIGGSAAKLRAIVDAQGVDDADGHALAGFIEAEGCFTISENNRGTTWLCAMTLTQRADDADMLVDIARVTGVGRLYAIRARHTSRPQVCWSVSSKLECRELSRLLRRYPLRGRKRREFDVWSTAVDRWTASLHGGPGSHDSLMRGSAAELRRLRRYVDSAPREDDAALGDADSEHAWRAFLGGFFSGEGSFSLNGKAAACIHLRADDAPLLRRLRTLYGIGSIHVCVPPGQNPTARWNVCRQAELPRAIELLDSAMLRGRKRREFEAWRIGAAEYARGGGRDERVIAAAAARLALARAYVDTDVKLPSPTSAAEAYAEVLRAFAAEVPDGPLTCTAYARARLERHPEWPQRNTIALAFGGWAAALRAAGLGSRLSARSSGTRTSGVLPIGDNISSMGRSSAEAVVPPAPGMASAPVTAEAQPLSADLCWLLSRASYTLTTELTAAFEQLGLSPRANCVLAAAMTGDHTQSEVARIVGLDKTTMVVTLDELEAAGLAERRASPHDRRARVIAVTPAGKRKVQQAEEIADRVRADVLSVLPEHQRKVFLEALTRLVSDRLSEPVACSQPVRRRAPRA